MELKTDRQIAGCKNPGDYQVGVENLHLNIYPTKSGVSKRWRVRTNVNGKRQKFTLGYYPEMSKKAARDARNKLFADLADGKHPTIEKAKAVEKVVEQQNKIDARDNFESVSLRFVAEIKSQEWKTNGKSKAQWLSTFDSYVYPYIGHKLIDEISVDDVVELITPIWMSKHETADRVLGRIKNVIDFAIAMKISDKANPADYHSILKYRLPKYTKKVKHFAALPYSQLGEFFKSFDKKFEASHDAIRMIVLTGMRQLDVRAMKWDQLNLEEGFWMAHIHKASKDDFDALHKVPLSTQALDILKRRIQQPTQSEYVFAAGGKGYISEAALRKVLKGLDFEDAMGDRITMHGFRSCFMDWVRENKEEEDKIADQQLAHAEQNKVFAAYARGDLYDRRVSLMQRYSDYIETKAAA